MSKKQLSLILFFPLYLLAHYSLSVGAIFQNEAPYLKEWIEFHKMQGVEHFFLYNNLSQDDFQTVLTPYIEKGEVSLIEWPYLFTPGKNDEWCLVQCGAYRDALKRCESEWIAFIDLDEFLFCSNGTSLVQFLKNYKDFGGLVVNSVYFGTSHVEEIPPGDLMIELLTETGPLDNPSLLSVKSIVQPERVQGCTQPHTFLYKKNSCGVNPLFEPVCGKEAASVHIDEIRLNHYWSRTEKFFRERKIAWRNRCRNEDERFVQRWCSEYVGRIDTEISQFIPELRKKLFP